MKETLLLKIALASALIGLFALYIISDNIAIKEITLDEIDKERIGNTVKISGRVNKVTELDKVTFLDITQPVTTKIVVFREKEKDEALELEQDDYIEIIGKIEDYEGEMEIIAERIRRVE